MRTYLVTFPDASTADTFLQRLHYHGARCTWVAVEPDPRDTLRRHFTDEKAWDTLKDTVHQALTVAQGVGPDATLPWPTSPFDQWTSFHKKILITMAVTRWDYLSPTGLNTAKLLQDYRDRRLPFQPLDDPSKDEGPNNDTGATQCTTS